eukprot:EG_transcript_13827
MKMMAWQRRVDAAADEAEEAAQRAEGRDRRRLQKAAADADRAPWRQLVQTTCSAERGGGVIGCNLAAFGFRRRSVWVQNGRKGQESVFFLATVPPEGGDENGWSSSPVVSMSMVV